MSRAAEHASVLVTRDDLARRVDAVLADVDNPEAGLFGPDSAMWTVSRESILFLGAGRAMLLQLAHPYVAYAIDQHSETQADPLARFRRTFEHVFAMFFDAAPKAVSSARRVHAIHERITGRIGERIGAYRRGQRYRANEPHALMWVYATLFDTAVQVYELFFGALPRDLRERYYRESHRFAAMFGVPDELLPPDWDGFAAYNRRMWESDELVVSKPAFEIGRFLLGPRHPLLRPLAAWYRMITGVLMPPRLADGFGLPHGRLARVGFRLSVAALRAVYRRMSPDLRALPAFIDACQRIGVLGPLRPRHQRMRDATLDLGERMLALVGDPSRSRQSDQRAAH